ncbi:MAG TPA: hypothetical protein VGE07_27055, partial [Herpetosiphonaceae bacterium]
ARCRSMEFRNAEGATIALTITGYQYPRELDALYASNWLLVRLDLSAPAGTFSATNACLLTYEGRQLADWLASAAAGAAPGAIGFVEPCLFFEAIAAPAGITIRVTLEHAFRPPWAVRHAAWRFGYVALFPLAPAELERAAATLRRQLAPYPQRAER